MKRRWTHVWGLAALLLFMSACGKAGTPGGAGGSAAGADRIEEPYRPSRTFDWKQEKWNSALKKGADFPLYAEDFIEGEEVHREGEYEYSMLFYGDALYELFADHGTGNFLLRKYDTGERQFVNREMTLPKLEGCEGMTFYIQYMDIAGDNELVLFVNAVKDGARQAYLAVHMDMEGGLLAQTDLTTAMKENGIWATDDIFLNVWSRYDPQGYYIFCETDSVAALEQLYYAPKDGTTWKNVGIPDWICASTVFETPDYTPFIVWTDKKNQKMQMTVCLDGENRKLLAEPDMKFVRFLTLTQEGYLYYVENNEDLYRWDLVSGATQLCMDTKEAGIYSVFACTGPLGLPVLFDWQDAQKGQIRVYHTTTVPVEHNIREIQVKDLRADGNPYLSQVGVVAQAAVRFNSRSNDVRIVVDQPNTKYLRGNNAAQEREEFRAKVMQELATGQMADIYVVSRDDMLMLYEKGALADLSDVLTDDIRADILPGSQKAGVIDGKQIGLIPNAPAMIAVVRDDFWEKDTWTLEEMLDCLEQHPQYTYALNSVGGDVGRNMLYDYFLYDIGDTPFVDFEKGTCDFDTPLFRRLLELLKTYQYAHMWEIDEEKYQKTAGFVLPCYGYGGFTLQMSQIPPGYHIVGLPSESGKGNYWDVDAYVVVSKDAQNREEIDRFLRLLFGEEAQLRTESAVRVDVYEKNMTYNKQFDYWSCGNTTIFTKPDGSFWLEEYSASMEKCTYPQLNAQDLREIISGEADGYFMGLKSLDETIDIIQNRAQLYLNERK